MRDQIRDLREVGLRSWPVSSAAVEAVHVKKWVAVPGFPRFPVRTKAVQQHNVLRYVIVFALWPLASGCITLDRPRSPQTIADAAPGMALQELEQHFGRATHEFTVNHDEDTYICVSYAFGSPTVRLYFLLRNECLVKVLEPPRFQRETVTYDDGSSYRFRKPGLTKERVATVLESGDLSESELRESVAKRQPKRKKPEFFNNLWPVDFITAPARLIGLPATLAAAERYRKRMRYYDPFKTVIGMMVGQVDDLYGSPKRVRSLNGRVLRMYGELRYPATWVGVEFVDERVTGVFSNDFFDRIWIVER